MRERGRQFRVIKFNNPKECEGVPVYVLQQLKTFFYKAQITVFKATHKIKYSLKSNSF